MPRLYTTQKNDNTHDHTFQIDEFTIRNAYKYWLRYYRHNIADRNIKEFQKIATDKIEENQFVIFDYDSRSFGRLKQARLAQLLSAQTVADKMLIKVSAYQQIETAELSGMITLKKLNQAAQAMDCELIYTIRPKSKKLFSQVIWDKIIAYALKSRRLAVCDSKRVAQCLASAANDIMFNTQFRRLQGWSQRDIQNEDWEPVAVEELRSQKY